MSFSFIGALMALVPAAKRALAGEDMWERRLDRDRLIKHVALLNSSRGHLIDHCEALQRSLDDERRAAALWREETRRLRGEVARLNEGAHRCQHQADLNRAMAQQALAQYAQMQNMQSFAALGMQGQQACTRSLEDCGMHHAEMVNRLNAQR